MSNPEDQLRQAIVDEEHLKLLGIAYLVSAAMNAFFSVFGLFYAGMGVLFTTVLARAPSGPGPEPPPEFIGWVFGFFGFGMFLIMITVGVLKFMTYQRLKQRRSRTFCMVVAGISCLGMPYGTLLGVFTFLVLGRPSVSKLFAPESPSLN
jgi:hypothetical protein